MAEEAVGRLQASRSIRWERIDRGAAIRSAIRAGLRGMDAIVVAHAKHAGAVLVTLDGEVEKRGGREVRAVSPEKVVAA